MAVNSFERLPEWSTPQQWARVAWVNTEAKSVWVPRVTAINGALQRVEIESVYSGLRSSALVFCNPEELVKLSKEVTAKGASLIPLALEGMNNSYSAGSVAYIPGKPIKFRTIVTTTPAEWMTYGDNDEFKIGSLLGYPKCCSEFYKKIWVDEKWRDTTYPMAVGGTEGPPESNILLRWLGIRFVRHLPCSFNCQGTIAVAEQYKKLAIELGFGQEMDWMRQMLSWNVEWTALHGIAEVKTPVLKFTTNTDPSAKKVVIQKQGVLYPAEGATGLAFPFQPVKKRKVTDSQSFMASLSYSGEWTQNGFTSQAAMEKSHAAVLKGLPELASGSSVLDLGCGNGVLLEKINNIVGDTVPYGVDIAKDALAGAYKRLNWGYFTLGNISDVDTWAHIAPNLVLFMPGRLQEMSPEDAAKVRSALRAIPNVLMYAYGDWREKAQFDTILDDTYTKAYAADDALTRVILFVKS